MTDRTDSWQQTTDANPPKYLVQLKLPGKGWSWQGQNKAGENVWKRTPGRTVDSPKPSGSGGGGGGGGGYGGGGGGSADPGLSTYIQEYRLRFHPGGTPPSALLSAAKAGKWSLAYFDQQIRLKDKSYFRSVEAKRLLPSFNRTMKVLFPGLADKTKEKALMKSSFYRKTALWYLKNGVGLASASQSAEALYGRITNTAKWNRQNPYWNAYSKNKNIGVVAEANPLLYKSYLESLQQNFAAMGIEQLPEDYYRTFFKSRYASKSGMGEMQGNLKQVAEQGGSYGWWQGKGMGTGQVKTAALDSSAQGVDLRSRLAKSFGTRNSFLGNEQKGFDSQLTNQGKLVKPLI